MVPIVADAEAGFGGNLNAFELMKWMIEAGHQAYTLKTSYLLLKVRSLGGKVDAYTRGYQ